MDVQVCVVGMRVEAVSAGKETYKWIAVRSTIEMEGALDRSVRRMPERGVSKVPSVEVRRGNPEAVMEEGLMIRDISEKEASPLISQCVTDTSPTVT